jgi:hypothetical protein
MTRGELETVALAALGPFLLAAALGMWAMDALRVRLRGW